MRSLPLNATSIIDALSDHTPSVTSLERSLLTEDRDMKNRNAIEGQLQEPKTVDTPHSQCLKSIDTQQINP